MEFEINLAAVIVALVVVIVFIVVILLLMAQAGYLPTASEFDAFFQGGWRVFVD